MTITATIFENPRFFKGPLPELVLMRAKDGDTWQAGQFCRRTASGVVACLSQAAQINGIFASTQAKATSSSDVPVYVIPDSQTQLVIRASYQNANDTTATTALIGKARGLNVNTSICSLSTSCDTAAKACFMIQDIYANKDKYGTDTDETPGQYIVTIRDSFLTAQGL